jgi:hypothetical protein
VGRFLHIGFRCTAGADAEPRYKQVRYTEFLEQRRHRGTVRHGSLHLLAQDGAVCWPEPVGPSASLAVTHQKVFIPAMFLVSTEASPLYSAVEAELGVAAVVSNAVKRDSRLFLGLNI